MVISFVSFLLLFAVIGLYSARKSASTNKDYLVAGRSIPPWLVALSAVATNNSGYMFIGQIGFTYLYGLSSIWLMIGWIAGDICVSFLAYKRIRVVSEKQEAISFGGVLSRWHGTDYRRLRFLVGILTVLFLGVYAAAQLKAGSKALHVLLGWPHSVGAIIGSFLILAYCLAGGIRASIWTDAAQSIVMIGAMIVLVWAAIDKIGPTNIASGLYSISPSYMSLKPPDTPLPGVIGGLIWFLGWFMAGVGILGMPHIMVRYMTLDDAEKMGWVRLYYYSWYVAFYAAAIAVGMFARLLLPEMNAFDPELALPTLAIELLSPMMVGVILAGIFAATMSTADSLILSCSASLTRDILPKEKDSYMMTKLATVMVTFIALMIALFGTADVFNLVLIALSALASAFVPIIFVYIFAGMISEVLAVGMMVVSVSVCILWREVGLGSVVYEILPGILSGLLFYIALRKTRFNRLDSRLPGESGDLRC